MLALLPTACYEICVAGIPRHHVVGIATPPTFPSLAEKIGLLFIHFHNRPCFSFKVGYYCAGILLSNGGRDTSLEPDLSFKQSRMSMLEFRSICRRFPQKRQSLVPQLKNPWWRKQVCVCGDAIHNPQVPGMTIAAEPSEGCAGGIDNDGCQHLWRDRRHHLDGADDLSGPSPSRLTVLDLVLPVDAVFDIDFASCRS